MTQVVLRLVFLADAEFFGATSCGLLRATTASDSASDFASPRFCEHLRDLRVAMAMNPPPSARLTVKVVPGSSRDQIVGWLGEALKIKVTAPPEKGRANEAVASLLAERLGLPADAVAVVSGHSSPAKVITINGMDDEAIKKALG
jgi:uncharacterized protein